jgi:hypothetical protein
MSPLVKTKSQVNFKDFKRFGAFKELVEQKNVVFNSFVCKLGFFGTSGPVLNVSETNVSETNVLNWPTSAKKPQFTQELVK